MSRRASHWPTKFFVNADGLRIGEHPLDLLVQHVGLAEPMLFGERQQLLVGHRAPEEIGEPVGQGEVVER